MKLIDTASASADERLLNRVAASFMQLSQVQPQIVEIARESLYSGPLIICSIYMTIQSCHKIETAAYISLRQQTHISNYETPATNSTTCLLRRISRLENVLASSTLCHAIFSMPPFLLYLSDRCVVPSLDLFPGSLGDGIAVIDSAGTRNSVTTLEAVTVMNPINATRPSLLRDLQAS